MNIIALLVIYQGKNTEKEAFVNGEEKEKVED